MKLSEWEKAYDYGTTRVCKHCKNATVVTVDGYISTVYCNIKIQNQAGEVVKQNASCSAWERGV